MPVPNDWTLEGKVALITADTRGWATVLASALAEAGADVAVAGNSAEYVESAAAAVGQATPCVTRRSSRDHVRACLNTRAASCVGGRGRMHASRGF